MTRASCVKIGLGVTLFCSLAFGTVAPNFHGKLVTGKKTSLAKLLKNDRVLLLSFWASWCVPCLKELTEMTAKLKEHPEVPVDVVTVNVDQPDTQSEIKPTIRTLKANSGFDFPVIVDTKQEIFGRYQQSKTLPFSALIGPGGQLLRTFSGYHDGMFDEIRKEIAGVTARKSEKRDTAGE